MAKRRKAQIGQTDYKTLYDWSGGMNDFIDPALLNDNESARLENASLDEKGTLFPAKGSRKRYSTDFSVKPTNGLGAFYKSDGTSRLLIGADNELYTDAPHLIYTYDSQTDFESGTKQNVEVLSTGSIKPKELPLASFARNSVAYLSDGTQVAANQPRFELGFGQAVLVEEGTANLLTNPGFENGTINGWSYIAGGSAPDYNYTVTTEDSWEGNYCVKLWTSANATKDSAIATAMIPVDTTKTYACSVWVKGDVQELTVQCFDSNGTFLDYIPFPLNDKGYQPNWVRDTVIVGPSNFKPGTAKIRIKRGVYGASKVGYIDAAQIEEKPYATSFTDSTRSPETLTIPTAGVLSYPNPFTIKGWFIARQPSNIAGADDYKGIIHLAGPPFTAIYINGGMLNAAWNNSNVIALTTYNVGDVIFFAWVYDGTKHYLYVGKNGAALVSGNAPAPSLSTNPTVIYVGSNRGSAFANILFDDLQITNRAESSEEIAQAYASGQPLPVDEWTTYKLNFDGNLLPDSKDLSSILGITSLDAADYNGTYWLISGDNGKIVKYDGTTATDLTSDFGLSGTKIRAIKWNGSYWFVAGDSGKIKKYDGTTVTDLTSTLGFGTSAIYSLEWNGFYWLIGGANGKIKKYDGITVTDLTSTFGFGTDAIKAIKWGSTYFLVGGGAGKIKKYDGSAVTDLTSTLSMGGDINTIGWNGSYFLIGANAGKIKKYDGSTVTDLTSTFAFSSNVYSIAWDGKNWYVSASGTLKKYDGSTVTDMSPVVNAFPYTTPYVFYGDGVFIFGGKPISFSFLPDTYTYAWYSPVLDVTNATDKNSGHIAIEADIPGATTIVAKSRSSPDGMTWSDWYNALSDGTLQHPADNYIQIMLQMKPSKGDLPTINKATISFDGQAEATLLASDFTPGGQFFMDMLLDYMVIVNGIDAPRKYDGKELTLLGGSPPHGSHVVTHKNRLWMARGSRLYFSDLLNLESWPVLNFIDISPNDGDVITGLKTYGDYLVITKGRSMWLLTGEGPNTFAVKRIHTDRGAYAPRSLTVVEGHICFVSDDGIYFSDLSKAVLISERIRKYWNTLNLRRINQAVAFYVDHKLYVAVPEGNSMTNNAVIVYDMLRQAFVGIRRNWNISCYTSFREGGRLIHLFGDSRKGQIYKMNEGYSDDGKPIPFLWKSKELDFDVPDAYKRWNKIYVQVRPSQYDAELIFTFFVDGKQIGSTSVAVPAATNGEIYTLLVLASKAGVVGGKRLAIQVAQNVLDNPVGIHRVSVEYIIHGIQPSFYA